MKTLKITMIHDLTCSWSPIGYRHLQRAAHSVADRLKLELYFLPYEINPGLPAGGEAISAMLQRRFNWNSEQRADYRHKLLETGRRAGVNFDFSQRTHYYNTQLGHLLMHWAEGEGQQVALNEALMEAYFTRGMALDQLEVLVDIASSAGLDADQIRADLFSEELRSGFAAKQQRVAQLDIASVPGFLIDDQHLVSGSGSVESFRELLLGEINAPVAA